MGTEKRGQEARSEMSEELRHKFNRLTFYTLLFTFLGVSMTFIIFSTVAVPTVSCTPGQYVQIIGTANDTCAADFQTMRMGASSCVITTGTATCSGTATFNPVFPTGTVPNVTIAAITNNGASFSAAQLLFTGQSNFLDSNSTMTINVPKSCSIASPCDLTLFGQHQLAIAFLAQQLFQFGMFCKNSNSTSSVSLEVYSSPSLTGTYKETGENLAVTSATCNTAPITFLQDSTAQLDINPDCATTGQASPCFYKIRIVNSPSTAVVAITFTKFFLTFYSNVPLIPTLLPSPGDNTVAGIVVTIPVVALQAINSPLIINFTWVAVECITSVGYKAGNC